MMGRRIVFWIVIVLICSINITIIYASVTKVSIYSTIESEIEPLKTSIKEKVREVNTEQSLVRAIEYINDLDSTTKESLKDLDSLILVRNEFPDSLLRGFIGYIEIHNEHLLKEGELSGLLDKFLLLSHLNKVYITDKKLSFGDQLIRMDKNGVIPQFKYTMIVGTHANHNLLYNDVSLVDFENETNTNLQLRSLDTRDERINRIMNQLILPQLQGKDLYELVPSLNKNVQDTINGPIELGEIHLIEGERFFTGRSNLTLNSILEEAYKQKMNLK